MSAISRPPPLRGTLTGEAISRPLPLRGTLTGEAISRPLPLRGTLTGIALMTALLVLAACKQPPSSGDAKQDGAPVDPATPEAPDTAAGPDTAAATPTPTPEPSEQAPRSELDRLFEWMPAEPLAVSFDRLRKPFDPELLAVVFGIPPMAADLLDERQTLDEALDLVFDGEGEAGNWMTPTTFAFTVGISKSPYYLRPLSKPVAAIEPLLVAAEFTKNTIDAVDVWLPSGSFPWRIALLGGDVAAFIPIDVPGAGLEPFAREGERQASPVETELRTALGDDRNIELVLVASGPLIHYDVKQSIAQVQFALRGSGDRYEGQIVLGPTSDVDECANELRAREHPEENQQIQALLKQVEFVVTEGMVLGRLELDAERLQHLLRR